MKMLVSYILAWLSYLTFRLVYGQNIMVYKYAMLIMIGTAKVAARISQV